MLHTRMLGGVFLWFPGPRIPRDLSPAVPRDLIMRCIIIMSGISDGESSGWKDSLMLSAWWKALFCFSVLSDIAIFRTLNCRHELEVLTYEILTFKEKEEEEGELDRYWIELRVEHYGVDKKNWSIMWRSFVMGEIVFVFSNCLRYFFEESQFRHKVELHFLPSQITCKWTFSKCEARDLRSYSSLHEIYHSRVFFLSRSD